MNQKQAQRRYLKEFGVAMALYAALVAASAYAGAQLEPGALRTALLASPVLGILLIIRSVVRQIRHSDEFMRKTTVEHLAVAAAVTAGATFTYGFLELAGFPKLSMFFVWPLMAVAWIAASTITYLRNR
ncbi:hypothetical protein [Achromobacter sp. DH1f]|uniref:hypothetical protein n=1 Tax=Achromobacter sp. DH1f TaxID=1397275 RepID=UPI0004685E2A|nr:hypothetical protein [Achromobacter sp. DH1f]